jgi:hypothetical protein
MTMRDLFKNDDEMQEYDSEQQEQPQLTDGGEEEQPQEGGVFDDGTGVIPGNDMVSTPRDFKYIDRFLRVKGMPNPSRNANEESNFLLSNDFAEQFIVNFLSEQDQRRIWRSLVDVVDTSEGSGNAHVALTDAKLLAARILMKRSSTENTLSLNERSAHIEQRTRSSISQHTNMIRPTNSGGWLSRLFGK